MWRLVYNSQGKYEEALEYYQKSLDIKIRVVGQDHPSVADSKYNLALLHKKRKETDMENKRNKFSLRNQFQILESCHHSGVHKSFFSDRHGPGTREFGRYQENVDVISGVPAP